MRRLLALGVSALLLLPAAACGGGEGSGGQQQAGATGQQGQSQEPTVQVSDSELRAFTRASLVLEGFRQEMRSRMQEAGREEARQVRQQLMQERDSIIEAAGLSGGVARYDSIMQGVKMNDALQERYTSLRDSMEADSAAADSAS